MRIALTGRFAGLALLSAAVATIGGCAGRPDDVLATVPAPPGAAQVEMLVATTRKPDSDRARMFTGERDADLNFADISISVPAGAVREVGAVQWPSRPGDPSREFVAVRADPLSRDQALSVLHNRLKKSKHRRVLVFVHGYNTRFGEAVFRFAQIAHDAQAPTLPVLFTWPSRGSLLGYTYDRESANYSRDALERVLQYFARDPAVAEIDILAHSMGNWVTLEALRQMAIRNGRITPRIKNVMLAAPDVDVDVFRRQIAEMGPNRPPFTLFVSQDDGALALSSRIWGGEPRVGSVDPKAEPYRSMFSQQKINVIDLTDISSGDRLGHTKFAQSPDVVQAIGRRLAGGQMLHEGPGGLGDRIAGITTGAAATVGRAAGVAISAPIAIIDGRTRDHFGEQLRDLGSEVRSTGDSAGRVTGQPY